MRNLFCLCLILPWNKTSTPNSLSKSSMVLCHYILITFSIKGISSAIKPSHPYHYVAMFVSLNKYMYIHIHNIKGSRQKLNKLTPVKYQHQLIS